MPIVILLQLIMLVHVDCIVTVHVKHAHRFIVGKLNHCALCKNRRTDTKGDPQYGLINVLFYLLLASIIISPCVDG